VCYQQGKRTQNETPLRGRTAIKPLQTLNEISVILPIHAFNAQNTRTETAPALAFSPVNLCVKRNPQSTHGRALPVCNLSKRAISAGGKFLV
jgi:hypothetical protein